MKIEKVTNAPAPSHGNNKYISVMEAIKGLGNGEALYITEFIGATVESVRAHIRNLAHREKLRIVTKLEKDRLIIWRLSPQPAKAEERAS